jgi:hypothetical protein
VNPKQLLAREAGGSIQFLKANQTKYDEKYL